MLRLYRYLEEHIEEKRKENPFYAEYFEWLAKKIEKKYGKKWGKFQNIFFGFGKKCVFSFLIRILNFWGLKNSVILLV